PDRQRDLGRAQRRVPVAADVAVRAAHDRGGPQLRRGGDPVPGLGARGRRARGAGRSRHAGRAGRGELPPVARRAPGHRAGVRRTGGRVDVAGVGGLGAGREVFVLQAHVVAGAVVQRLDLGVAEHAHLARGIAEPHLAAADDLARGHQRAGADETVLLHHRAVEHDRAHADETGVADPAGVDDRLVADGDVLAYDRGEAAELGVRAVVADMHDGAVLDAGARADADEVDVAA